ncbi:MAG: Rrf2 family transcriptional regulator [Pseudomonadota bacterium]
MKRNGRFSLALHALGHLAVERDRARTSAEIAAWSGTHAGFVRRVLGLLREDGLVVSEKGHAGGWRLARCAEAITLADVYAALGERLVSGEGEGPDNPPNCAIERAVGADINAALVEAEAAMRARLAQRTVADLAGAMKRTCGEDRPAETPL